jgi:uracil-DNA glycosylase family 4
MDEGLRRQYLAAMGIPLWLPRDAPEWEAPRQPVAAADPSPPPRPTRDIPRVPLATPMELPAPTDLGWDELQTRVADCRACSDLVRSRSRTVFGVGNREARLMVVGEAPGVDEDRQGEPFVGRAGQLLNRMLLAMGFPREQVYIANILKCHPPGNRDPSCEEAGRCEPFLLRQMALVNPGLILSVGRISAQNLLKTDTPVGKLRGRVHYFGEQRIPLVVTYHPAYLLRQPEQKARAWQDLQLALRTLRATD